MLIQMPIQILNLTMKVHEGKKPLKCVQMAGNVINASLSCAYWEFLVHREQLQALISIKKGVQQVEPNTFHKNQITNWNINDMNICIKYKCHPKKIETTVKYLIASEDFGISHLW